MTVGVTRSLYNKGVLMDWPDYFPEGCPPSDAVPANGTFLRATKKHQPQEGDFISHYERDPERFREIAINASALSVYTDVEDIMRMKRRSVGMRKKYIARGTLYAHHGVMKHTPNVAKQELSHYDWWRVRNCDPLSIFEPFLDANGKNL